MTSKELKESTQKFAIEIIEFTESFPKTKAGDILGKQLLRSACSVGANYRSQSPIIFPFHIQIKYC